MTDTDFAALAEPVARHFWGDPNKSLSNKTSLRWGDGGSRVLYLDGPGNWRDFASDEQGGVIDLVMRETGADRPGAIEWLQTEGFIPEREGRTAPQPRQERHEAPSEDNAPPEDDRQPEDAPPAQMKPVKGYRYTDRDGNPLYEVIRYQFQLADDSWQIDPKTGNPKKTFRQRRKVGDEYKYNLDGIDHTIYRHREVEIAIAEGKTCFLVEGEKDVETLESWGLVASTNSGGAQHWTPEHAELFRGADVVILVDNDEAGRSGALKRAKSLCGIAGRVRVLDFAEFIPGFPAKLDVTDWKERFGGTAEQLSDFVGRLPVWTPPPPVSGFGATTMGYLASTKIAYDWLVKGLVERGGVFIVAGEKQSGKSFFVIDIGMKIARGIDYGGRKVKHGLVIHMACEDGKGVQMRVEGYRRDAGLSPDVDVPFIVMDRGFTLMSDDVVDKFIAECRAWAERYEFASGIKLELIIIDTFSMATEGLDEIHSGDVGKVLARVNRIAKETGSTVCLVHHLNAEGKRVRGHSSLTANVSQVIEIRQMTKFQTNRNMPTEFIKDSDGRIVRQAILEKNKNGPNQLKWRFILRKVDLGQDDDGFEISTCVCDTPSSEVGESVSRSKLSQDQKMVLDALIQATYDVPVDVPGSALKGTTEKAFVAQVRKVWNFRAPAEEPEARTKELSDVLKRTVTVLINGGYARRDNDRGILWSLGKDDRRREPVEPKPKEPMSAGMKEAIDDGVPF